MAAASTALAAAVLDLATASDPTPAVASKRARVGGAFLTRGRGGGLAVGTLAGLGRGGRELARLALATGGCLALVSELSRARPNPCTFAYSRFPKRASTSENLEGGCRKSAWPCA